MELLKQLEQEAQHKETTEQTEIQRITEEVFGDVDHLLGLENVPPIKLFKLLLMDVHTHNTRLMQGKDVLGTETHLVFIKKLAGLISETHNLIDEYKKSVDNNIN